MTGKQAQGGKGAQGAGRWVSSPRSRRLLFLALFTLALSFSRWDSPKAIQEPNTLAVTSAADFSRSTPLAVGSLATAYGNRLSTQTVEANLPLSTSLGGTTVRIGGVAAPLLFVSPGQVNFQIPAGLPAGEATITITSGSGDESRGKIDLAPVSPGLFAADYKNKVPVGSALRFRNGKLNQEQALWAIEKGTSPGMKDRLVPAKIDPGEPGDVIYLVLYGTGIRGQARQEDVKVIIGGISTPVQYAGDQRVYAGLDQVNVELPDSLIGRGQLELAVTIQTDGPSNLILSNSLLIETTPRTGLPSPKIHGISPVEVMVGTGLVIEGSGFSEEAKENEVWLGNSKCPVVSATSTKLTVQIPYGAETSFLNIKTPFGEKASDSEIKVQTSISGLVTDTGLVPIGGMHVELKLRGEHVNSVTTKKDGSFLFRIPLAGDYDIVLNGPGPEPQLPYPVITFKHMVLADRDNPVGVKPLEKNSNTSIFVRSGLSQPALVSDFASRSLETLNEQGIVFQFQGDAVFNFPDTGSSGTLTLSKIKNSLTPVPLPPERFSKVVAQITSIGAKLNPGGKLIFPNEDGYGIGENVDLYLLEQDLANREKLGEFIKVGTATVSADGRRIETAQNAIRVAGIYLVANPRQSTTVAGFVKTEGDNLPVPRAQVRARGQQTLTDGNGSFLLPGVQVVDGDELAVEAILVRANGSIARVQKTGIRSTPGGITRLEDPLLLPLEEGNRSPIVSIDTRVIRVNAGQEKTVPFSVFDLDSENLVVSLTPGNIPWTRLQNLGQGKYNLILTPPSNEGGTYVIRLAANDGVSEPAVQVLDVLINGKPIASGQNFLETHQNTPLKVTLNGTDPNNDPLTFRIIDAPRRGKLNEDPSNLIYTPGRGHSGLDDFTFVSNDGLIDSDKYKITIRTLDNQAPSLEVPESWQVSPGEEINFSISAKDSAAGQVLTLESKGDLPRGAMFNQEGAISNPAYGRFKWTPTGMQTGRHQVTFLAKDDGSSQMSVEKVVNITVRNRQPVFAVLEPRRAIPGQAVTFVVTATDPDDGQSLTMETRGSLPQGSSFDPLSRRFSWTPLATQVGDHTINFFVKDNGSPIESDTMAVTIRVSTANRPPVLTVREAWTARVGEQLTFQVNATDPDPDQALVITSEGTLPMGATFTAQGGSGEFNWKPTAAQIGNYTIRFTVTDNGMPRLSETRMVTITVVLQNRMPVLTVPTAQTVNVGEQLRFQVSAIDPDPDQTLSMTAVTSAGSLPTGATFNASGGTGEFNWTPTALQIGSYLVNFSVSDNGQPPLSETRTVAITVVQPNRAPVLTVPTARTVSLGEQLKFQVSATDPDPGQSLAITATTQTDNLPTDATFISTGGSGEFNWTPTASQVGSHTIWFTATDNGVPRLSQTQTVAITVVPANRQLVLSVPEVINVVAGLPVNVEVTAATPNGSPLIFTASGLPAGAALRTDLFNPRRARLFWVPDQTQTGVYQVTLTVADNSSPALTDAKTIRITVAEQPTTVGQWQPTNGPYGNSVYAIQPFGTDLIAGTDDGVYVSTNNGLSWKAANNGLPSPVSIQCLVVSGDLLFAGNAFGGVYVSADKGQNWKAVRNGLPATTVTSLAVSGSAIFAGTYGEGVYLSTNNGQTWAPVNSSLTSKYVNALAINGAAIYAATDGGGIFLSTNNGQTWTAVNKGLPSQNVISLALSGNNILAGIFGQGMYLSTNNGQGWTPAQNGLSVNVIRTILVNGNRIFTLSNQGIHLSTNNARSWSLITPQLPGYNFFALAVLGDNIFAGTDNGVYQVAGAGYTRSSASNGLPPSAIQTIAVSGGNILAGTSRGLYLSANNGQNWTLTDNPLLNSLGVNSLLVQGASVFAATADGVRVSQDNGVTWQAANIGMPFGTAVFSLLSADGNLYAGAAGGIYLSTNNAQNWTRSSNGFPDNAICETLVATANGLFAGTNGSGIYRSTNNGQNWTPVNEGIPGTFGGLYVRSLVVNGSSIFAATHHGIYLSTNNGESWVAINNGLPNDDYGRVVGYALAARGGTTFLGTLMGVYQSIDNGQTWTIVDNRLTLDVRSLFIGGNRLYAGSRGVFTLPLSAGVQ